MMKLFDIRRSGADEIVAAVGLIGNTVAFDKWAPIIPLGIREVKAIVGPEAVQSIADYYAGGSDDSKMEEALYLLQQAVAFFTWLKIIPTLDAQHDEAGRGKRLGENEKGLTALQEFKDEENIRALAYQAVDALVELFDREQFDWWVASGAHARLSALIVQSKDEFDRYYRIGSHRLFLTLMPMMEEVQIAEIAPRLGSENYTKVLSGDADAATLRDYSARAVALLSIKKAVERLPVEALPEGIVQVQQSQPVKSRLRAEKEAREAVARSLGEDAALFLSRIEDLVGAMATPKVDPYVPGHLVHRTGFSF